MHASEWACRTRQTSYVYYYRYYIYIGVCNRIMLIANSSHHSVLPSLISNMFINCGNKNGIQLVSKKQNESDSAPSQQRRNAGILKD
jgi:hypothetical protein